MATPTIVIAAGGSGGHLFPGIAVAENLASRGISALLATGAAERERRMTTALPPGMPRIEFEAPRPPSRMGPGWLAYAARVSRAAGGFVTVLREHDTAVLLSMGGFVNVAPVVAARRVSVPVVLHEANVIPGRANRWLSRMAEEVLLGWRESADRMPRRARCVYAGIPVRDDLARWSRADARASLGIAEDARLVVVVGGSQGAQALNGAAAATFGQLASRLPDLAMLVLSGHGKTDTPPPAAQDHDPRFRVVEFETEMGRVYAAADLVVSRAGAGTLAELSALGCPAILVPYPHAADGHQDANAAAAARTGGAEILPETELVSGRLADRVSALLSDPERLATMSSAIRGLNRADAAAAVADRLVRRMTRADPPTRAVAPMSAVAALDPEAIAAEMRGVVRSAETALRVREPMSRHTYMKVGGAADVYVEPGSVDDLAAVLALVHARDWPLLVLGNGSNLLVRDGGIRGVALRLSAPTFRGVDRTGPTRIRAGGGVSLRAVVRHARSWGIGGLEFFEGIPGTVGGALRMNAGAMGSELCAVVRGIEAVDAAGAIRRLTPLDLGFRYRGCDGLNGACVTAVEFEGQPVASDEIGRRVATYEERRRATQPADPSAGCTFRNPPEIPAGRLIEELGLKGLRHGGASVSRLHGNFIVNEGDATAADVLWLIGKIRDEARRERGIDLEMEVVVVGEE